MEPPSKYISLFKIDGIPILPPLMTEERRQEMRNYKNLAAAIELKLKLDRGERISLSNYIRNIDEFQKFQQKMPHENSPNKEYDEVTLNNSSPEKFVTDRECGDRMSFTSSPKKIDTDQESDLTGTTVTFENEYLKVSNILNMPEESTSNEKSEKSYLRCLKRSDLFICDVTRNTLMIPSLENKDDIEEINTTSFTKNDDKLEENDNKTEENTILGPTIEASEINRNSESSKVDKLYRSLSYADVEIEVPNKVDPKVPTISIEPATPKKDYNKTNQQSARSLQSTSDTRSSKQLKNSPRRCSTSPALNNNSKNANSDGETQRKLIRSNSFTLDSPSDALIEHIVKCKREELQMFTHQSNNNEKFQCNSATKSDKLLREKQKRELRAPISAPQTFRLKHKKSPYDIKSSVKRKPKNPSVKIPSITSLKRKVQSPVSSVNSSQVELKIETPRTATSIKSEDFNCLERIKDMIEEIENKHRSKLKELLEKQQEEQKKMQENFEKQQKLLLEKFTFNINKKTEIKSAWSEEINSLQNKSSTLTISSTNNIQVQTDTPNNPVPGSKHCRNRSISNLPSPRKYDDENNSSCKSTPRRRLFSFEKSPINVKRLFDSSTLRRRENAATIINAYARGYLIRRLFKTEFIQRIVKTIHDTLLFVIEFHIETQNDESEANIKLKARLLQQLTSAYEHLHEVLFKYSIKERMEIIAKDRKILKAKANKYQRSPRMTS